MPRYAFRMRILPGQQEEYIRRHRAVWPAVKQACQEAGMRNYSIFIEGTDLFAYLECDDFPQASRRLAEIPQVAQWEAFMAPLMAQARADERGQGTQLLQEVFHLD